MKILIRIVKSLGALIGAYIVYMFAVAVFPSLSVPKQPIGDGRQPDDSLDVLPPESRRDVSFTVGGTPVSAWLYLPRDLPGDLSEPVPCVIMAHGLGGIKTMGLNAYAVRFQEAGFAVLAFDYRHFGASGGQPRQLAWIPYQQEDWSSAIDYARGLPEIDPARIALWGASLSGGHVVVAASNDPGVACVSAQCPLLDGDAGGLEVVKRVGLGHLLKLSFVHALRDLVRSWLGLSPHKIPLVGRPGTMAGFADAEVWEAFEQLASDDFVNEICARIFIRMDKYHPIKVASRITCPVLLQICDLDSSLPPRVVQDAEDRLGAYAEIIHYPIDHFDIYLGEHFEQAVADQLAFFQQHLTLR